MRRAPFLRNVAIGLVASVVGAWIVSACGGSVGTPVLGDDCLAMCAVASAAGCDAEERCSSTCLAQATTPESSSCSAAYEAAISCAASSSVATCRTGQLTIDGCTNELAALSSCGASGVVSGGAPTPASDGGLDDASFDGAFLGGAAFDPYDGSPYFSEGSTDAGDDGSG